jgi:flagellar biosynthetic protein FlhB
MSKDSAAEKTHDPTPKRRREATKEGQVARSAEVVSTLMMFLVIGVILVWSAHMVPRLVESCQRSFSLQGWRDIESGSGATAIRGAGRDIGFLVMPVAVVAAIVALLANLAQVGLTVNWELCGFKWDRLNPMNWVKKTFSMELVVNLAKAMAKGLGVILIAAWGLRNEPEHLWYLTFAPVGELGQHMQGLAFTVFIRVAIAMMFIAALDFMWQKHQHEKKLKMSTQELKDEMKEQEGDPYLKAAMKRRGRERVNESLSRNVEQATVVVRNPTHFAVALKYDRGFGGSPTVVAKGRGFKALRIIELAEEFGVPVITERPVARALYRSVKVGKTIPLELYRAVARILALVYKQQGLQAEDVQ